MFERTTAQKLKLSIKDFFSKCSVTFTEEILKGKPHFCAVNMPARQMETTFSGVFRTLSNIYDGAFLPEIVNDLQKTP